MMRRSSELMLKTFNDKFENYLNGNLTFLRISLAVLDLVVDLLNSNQLNLFWTSIINSFLIFTVH